MLIIAERINASPKDTRGLDSAILDPTDKLLYGALKAALAVNGKDDFCMEFIAAFREGRLE